MKKWIAILISLGLLVVAVTPAAAQEETPPVRDAAGEQEVYDRLSAIDPDAVPLFKQATNEMDAGDLAAAEADYLAVLGLANEFPDALRRLSYVEIQLGNTDEAVEYARRAVAV